MITRPCAAQLRRCPGLLERALGANAALVTAEPVLIVQDRVQEQRMDTGLDTLSKTSLDSLAKSIYTLMGRANNQLPCPHWA
jgi:hypothetical protein